jgi:hypothetical protein
MLRRPRIWKTPCCKWAPGRAPIPRNRRRASSFAARSIWRAMSSERIANGRPSIGQHNASHHGRP